MDDEAFERFRDYSTEQMARFFGAMEEMRHEGLENERRNQEEHRRFRADLRAAVREGLRLARETRRDLEALAQAQRVTEQKLQAFIDSRLAS